MTVTFTLNFANAVASSIPMYPATTTTIRSGILD